MNTLTKLALIAAILGSAVAAQAGGARGHHSSSGTYSTPHYSTSSSSLGGASHHGGSGSAYVYRNPYAAEPTVRVRGYPKSNGTVVLPYHRTPANDTVTDNLNYRGYGTVRVPRYLNGLE